MIKLTRERIMELSLMGATIDLIMAMKKNDLTMVGKVLKSVQIMLEVDPGFFKRLRANLDLAHDQMERDLREKGKSPIL